jgi:hypothetical protein
MGRIERRSLEDCGFTKIAETNQYTPKESTPVVRRGKRATKLDAPSRLLP